MKNPSLSLILLFLPVFLAAQNVHLEDFVVLEKYCPDDDEAVVRVLDQDGDEEFTYVWKHDGSTERILTISKKDFGRQFCVERHCPCGSVYESCFVFDPVQITSKKGSIEAENITCYGDKDGEVIVHPSGNAPFEFHWNNGGKTRSISGLEAGKYSVTVTDALGCSEKYSARVKQPRKLKMRPKLISKNKMFAAVKLEIRGGTPGYVLNGEKASKKMLISTQKMKRYEFELEDANGCAASAKVILRKKYKKKSRAVFAKNPKKKKKHKGRMKCPKLGRKKTRS